MKKMIDSIGMYMSLLLLLIIVANKPSKTQQVAFTMPSLPKNEGFTDNAILFTGLHNDKKNKLIFKDDHEHFSI